MRIKELKAQRDGMRSRFTAALAEIQHHAASPNRRSELRPVLTGLQSALAAINAEIRVRRQTDVLNAEMRWHQKRADDARAIRVSANKRAL